MRKLLLILFLVQLFSISLFAQSAVNPVCPKITVLGPASVTNPGEEMTFRVSMTGERISDLGYSWKATGGELVSGQNTSTIHVRIPNASRILVTATVEILGLPEGCSQTFSEFAAQTCKCASRQLDEYGAVTLNDEKKRIAKALREPETEPYSILYIVKYFPTLDVRSNQRIQALNRYLMSQKSATNRDFKILDVMGHAHTIIYLVPPGADLPTPE